jgi:hypothetical protein
MKKFVLVHIGFEPPTDEIMKSWGNWFESIADVTVENVGLGPAKEISAAGVKELPFDHTAVTGYTVIQVENEDKALEIAKSCPFITGIGLYEVRGM